MSERKDLPEGLKGLKGKYFTSRHPATHAEAENRKDVVFGVKSIEDLLDRHFGGPTTAKE